MSAVVNTDRDEGPVDPQLQERFARLIQPIPRLDVDLVRAKLMDSDCGILTHPHPEEEVAQFEDFVRSLAEGPLLDELFFAAPGIGIHLMRQFLADRDHPQAEAFYRYVRDKLDFVKALTGDVNLELVVNNTFKPGNLIDHVDRTKKQSGAVRMLLSFGRLAGTKVTPRWNVDLDKFYPELLRAEKILDGVDRAIRNPGPISFEKLLSDDPALLGRLREQSGVVPPYILDPRYYDETPANGMSLHVIEGNMRPGAIHRASYANRYQPGLMIVISAHWPDYEEFLTE